MFALVLFEDESVANFSPLVLWRTVFELRVGRHIMLDRLAQRLRRPVSGVWTRKSLARVAAHRCGALVNQPLDRPTLLVNGRWLLDEPIDPPQRPIVGVIDGDIAYLVCDAGQARLFTPEVMRDAERRSEAIKGWEQAEAPGRLMRYPWELTASLPGILQRDWSAEDARIESEMDPKIPPAQAKHLHVGARTHIHRTAVIDASPGPVYISDDVNIGAYAVIEGPIYIGSGTTINPHAWLHGGNTIGPVCRVGGEVHGCIIHGYTNKHHHGFLGHSCVGSWVNLGAGSCNSDLKNTYGAVRVPLHGPQQPEVATGETFFGAIIGDHAKIGINAVIPTGAVIGFAAMVATTRAIPRWVPSYGWVTDEGIRAGDPPRLLDVATKVMARRNVDMTDEEIELFLSAAESDGRAV